MHIPDSQAPMSRPTRGGMAYAGRLSGRAAVQVTLAGARDGGSACLRKACNPYTSQPEAHRAQATAHGAVLGYSTFVRAPFSSQMTTFMTM